MKKSYMLILNEYGKTQLSPTPVYRLLADSRGWMKCSSIDESGPLLLANIIPPEGSKTQQVWEVQIPYEFVLSIVSVADKKSLGFLMSDKDSDTQKKGDHSQ